ncbi:DUF350 domain-containing protein [Paenibacillus beijingensis]|uniref:Cell surface protein n=1 Tax=Paenibacillus beijingensis TaxID=1126833 RepID=A0A0D5NEE5_9BACL|nr:DUF350 domain-containing protein [Paenibacillus beijingensis]AJY73342.1 cell surface protein [Paenibacillus beijingensis]
MTLQLLVGTVLWIAGGAALLAVLMFVDSLFTRYKDLEEMRKGNVAVTTRFVLKLLAQTVVLARSIYTSEEWWEALIVSIIAFLILLALEWIVHTLLRKIAGFRLDDGTRDGKMAYALLSGSLHFAGGLLVAATL